MIFCTKQKNKNIFAYTPVVGGMLFCAWIITLFLGGVSAHAAFNEQINYQGKLTDTSDVAVADGTYNMRFWLLTSPSVATTSAEWTESLTGSNKVQVTNGLFSVMLGSTTPFTGVDFNQTLYLGVEIGGTGGTPSWDGEMSPRKIIGAVPAAFEAKQLDGIATSSFLRSDQADAITASEAGTLLTITQNGAGDILNLFDGGTEVFSVDGTGNTSVGTTSANARFTVQSTSTNDILNLIETGGTEVFTVLENGNVGISSSTPTANLTVQGISAQTNALFTLASSTATKLFTIHSNGQINASSTATSTFAQGIDIDAGCFAVNGTCIGGGAATFLALTDTFSSFTANRVPFTNSGGTALTDSASLVFDGTNFGIGSTTPNTLLSTWAAEDTALIALGDSTNNDQANIYTGTTSPEARVSAPIGSLFVDTVNGELYQKTGDDGGSTGWETFRQGTVGGPGEITSSFFVHRNGTNQTDFDNVDIVDWTTEDLDIGNDFDLTTERFTAPADGLYVLIARTTISMLNVEFQTARLYKNGSFFTEGTRVEQGSGGFNGSLVSTVMDLNAGDYVDVRIAHNGVDEVLEGGKQYTYFTGYQLSGTTTIVATGTVNVATQGQIAFYETGSNIISGTSSIFVDTNSNIGIGSTSPQQLLSVAGNMALSGALYDNTYSAGSDGYILKTTGSATEWIATSSLGLLGDVNDSITPNNIHTTGQTDEYCLTYEETGSTWEWQTCGGGSSLFTDGGNTTYLTSLSDHLAAGTSTSLGLFTVSTSSATTTATFAQYGSGDILNLFDGNTEVLTVLDGGNVGVGSSTPSALLSTWAAEDTALIALGDSTNNDQANIYTGTTSPEARVSAPIGSLFVDTVNGELYQKTGDDGGNSSWELFTQGTTTHMAKMTTDTATSVPNASTVKLEFDTVEFDTGGVANVSTDRFTIKRAGKYLINAYWASAASSVDDGEFISVLIYKNGSSIMQEKNYSPAATQSIYVDTEEIVDLQPGDYLEMYVYQNSGSSMNTRTEDSYKPRMSVIEIASISDGGETFVAKQKIEVIEDPSSGEFDFNNLPSGYDRYIIEGEMRSDESVAQDSLRVFFNEDTTESNYHSQQHRVDNAVASDAEADVPFLGGVPGDSAPADSFARYSMVIEDPTSSHLKLIRSEYNTYNDTDNSAVGAITVASNITAAVDRIRIRANGYATDKLSGKLTLYGEKEITAPGAQGSVFTDNASTTYLTQTGDNVVIGQTNNDGEAKFVVTQNGAYDVFNIFDGTTEVFTILDGGNVGVGSTSPTANLSVQGTAGQSADLFTISSSTGAELLTVSSGGNIGIGSTSPQQLLSVAGNMALSGALYDNTYSAGTDGFILKTTGSATEWIATSSLNVALSDTTGTLAAARGGTGLTTFGGTNTILYTTAADTLASNANFVFDGTNLGIGSSTPTAKLTVQGSAGQTDPLFALASSTNDILYSVTTDALSGFTVAYNTAATTTIYDGAVNAWSLATSTTALPIFAIDTSSGGQYATSTFNSSLVINNGAFEYDSGANEVSIENLRLGPVNFDTNAGQVSWIDLVIDSNASTGTPQSYVAQLDSNKMLTVYGEADGSGSVQNTRVLVGTTSAAVLSSTNIPDHSMIVGNGILCVDNGNDNCDDASRTTGTMYAVNTTVTGIDLAEQYPTKDSDLVAGDLVMLDPDNPIFVTKYDRMSSTTATSTEDAFLGVVSTAPGILLGGFGDDEYANETKVPVVLAGRVPVTVNFEGGSIYPGDRVSFSTVDGVGAKATTSGLTIGVALDSYVATSSSTSTDEGTVTVFVDSEYYFHPDQFVFDRQGNLGVGTSTDPNYVAKFGADIAATGFINISASSTKKEIEFLGEEDVDALTAVLRDINLATYRYEFEDASTTPLRLGLIAEVAPEEVLSADGKGVDLYKLSSLTLAGVQGLDDRVAKMELDLYGTSTAGVTFEFGTTIFDRVVAYFETFGVWITEGFTQISNLFADRLTVGTSFTPTGITLYDEIDGRPYCVRVVGGEMKTTDGECSVYVEEVVVDDGNDSGSDAGDTGGGDSATTTDDGVDMSSTTDDGVDTATTTDTGESEEGGVDAGGETGGDTENEESSSGEEAAVEEVVVEETIEGQEESEQESASEPEPEPEQGTEVGVESSGGNEG